EAGPDMAQAAAEAEQDEHRRKLQEYLAATAKVKHPSTKPYLNDQINRLDPLLKTVSKQEHADRNKRDALPDVAKDAQRDGKLASKPTPLGGRAAKEMLIQDKFRKSLPSSKSASQKSSGKTQPLQPPQSLAVSTNLLHKKKTAVKHEKMSTAGQPVGKPLGTLLEGSLQHRSRAPQAKRSPPKPPAGHRGPQT
uniref:Uncharacterized protein n=1 Tax=Anser cygnoides TaxID=8845 RepID=A0A8B9EAI4_ANSCY